MIDWSALVTDSALDLPLDQAEVPCSDPITRNKPHKTENVGTPETLAATGFHGFCSDVPSVPHIFEGPRVEEKENSISMSFSRPGDDGIEEQSAPHQKARESSCLICAYLCRPGLSNGYCGGRDDLPYAYTAGHPLRQLPADAGATCAAWVLHPALAP